MSVRNWLSCSSQLQSLQTTTTFSNVSGLNLDNLVSNACYMSTDCRSNGYRLDLDDRGVASDLMCLDTGPGAPAAAGCDGNSSRCDQLKMASMLAHASHHGQVSSYSWKIDTTHVFLYSFPKLSHALLKWPACRCMPCEYREAKADDRFPFLMSVK